MRDGNGYILIGICVFLGVLAGLAAADDVVPTPAAPPGASAPAPVKKSPMEASPRSEAQKPQPNKKKPMATTAATKAAKKKAEEKAEGTAQEGQTKYVTMPVVTPEVHAPRTSMKPNPTVLGVPRRKVTSGLSEGLKTAPGEGFKPPDWTKPLRDVQFDEGMSPIGKDEMDLVGHVRLHLDTIDFAADKFWYSKSEGKMHAEGNVSIVQGLSEMDAGEVFYNVPDQAALAKPLILAPRMDEQSLEKLRLSHGLLKAKDSTIFEPNQELKSDYFEFNMADSTGIFDNAYGRFDAYYYHAAKLRVLGPASADGEDVWVTTCNQNPPHYKIRMKKALIRDGQAVYATGAHLEIFDKKTPVYWPVWGANPEEGGTPMNFDFKSGYHSKVGYFVNAGQQFKIDPDASLGVRLYPTTRAGVGIGLESQYDYTKTPTSPLFLGKGTVQSLVTTEGRGYLELKHRQELFDDTVMLVQVEKWSDNNFFRDFFYMQYKNHDAPRSFVNVTYTQPGYIASGTIRPNTNNFVRETEQLPEGSFHLLDRPIAKNLYASFDTIDGFANRTPANVSAFRMINVGRLTYDIKPMEGLSLLPFDEVEGNFYSQELDADHPDLMLTNTLGATAQTRFHKEYDGMLGFSGFKHVVVPSVTYFYRGEPTTSVNDAPYFDFYDYLPGRSRLETKLDNVVFGKDGKLDEVWQVGRLTLYGGYDFWNELRTGDDYEAEIDIRPRPWWGWVVTGERHIVQDRSGLGDSGTTASNTSKCLLQQDLTNFNNWAFGGNSANGNAASVTNDFKYYLPYGDYNRLLTYFYYDDKMWNGRWNARVGFAYTQTESNVFNREVLYGAGYKVGENWGLAFEQRYDFERAKFVEQIYEIRRNLHCWEAVLQFRDREAGWDVGISFNLSGFPGTRVKF